MLLSASHFSPRTFKKWTSVRIKPEALIVDKGIENENSMKKAEY